VQRGGPDAATGAVVVVVDGVGVGAVVVAEEGFWLWTLCGCTPCCLCGAADWPPPQALETSARPLKSATAPSDLVRIASKLPVRTSVERPADVRQQGTARTFRGEGSNLQHPAPKADVLPIELPRRHGTFNQAQREVIALRSSEERADLGLLPMLHADMVIYVANDYPTRRSCRRRRESSGVKAAA